MLTHLCTHNAGPGPGMGRGAGGGEALQEDGKEMQRMNNHLGRFWFQLLWFRELRIAPEQAVLQPRLQARHQARGWPKVRFCVGASRLLSSPHTGGQTLDPTSYRLLPPPHPGPGRPLKHLPT